MNIRRRIQKIEATRGKSKPRLILVYVEPGENHEAAAVKYFEKHPEIVCRMNDIIVTHHMPPLLQLPEGL